MTYFGELFIRDRRFEVRFYVPLVRARWRNVAGSLAWLGVGARGQVCRSPRPLDGVIGPRDVNKKFAPATKPRRCAADSMEKEDFLLHHANDIGYRHGHSISTPH